MSEAKAFRQVATASRVMSHSSYPVSERSRQKVLRAAAELNYTPNSLARNLRIQRSSLIAILVGDNTDPYFAEITRGVEEVAKEQGYLTIICNAERDPKKELDYRRSLQDYSKERFQHWRCYLQPLLSARRQRRLSHINWRKDGRNEASSVTSGEKISHHHGTTPFIPLISKRDGRQGQSHDKRVILTHSISHSSPVQNTS